MLLVEDSLNLSTPNAAVFPNQTADTKEFVLKPNKPSNVTIVQGTLQK